MSRAQAATTDFRFGLGHIALEFAATLGGRRWQTVERLVCPTDLEHWLREANISSEVSADDALLASARELRDAIHRLLLATRAGETPTRSDVGLINRWAAAPVPAPQLGPRLERTWLDADPGVSALAAIARQAVELVTGPELAEVRDCASPSCSLMFIDRSRPGRRRWCSMERCGNRAKTAAYRRRRTPPSEEQSPRPEERSSSRSAAAGSGAREQQTLASPGT